jgi:RNA polymerase sigma-70 factor (ECF subfamily)
MVERRSVAPNPMPPEPAVRSDEDLMALVMGGSETAFESLVDRYSGRVLNVVYRYIGDRQRSEDITQEVFLRVHLHRLRYRPGGRFSAWLFTIAANLAKNEIRSRVRHRGTMSLDQLTEVSGDAELVELDRAESPEHWAEQAELQEAVAAAVAELPDPYREAVVLRDLNGMSYEEIAEILGVPGGTVRSRINRARHLLKKKLLPYIAGG